MLVPDYNDFPAIAGANENVHAILQKLLNYIHSIEPQKFQP